MINSDHQRVLRLIGYTLLLLHFSVIIAIWVITSAPLLSQGGPSILLALGRLFGLLAAGCALLQFMLMGRSPWLEAAFGLENLAKLHRLNGYATITLIVIHPILLTFGYAGLSGTGLLAQYVQFITKFEDVWRALIAEILFVSVVVSSIYIVRKHLAYERWYWVHLMVYAAILLAFSHQVKVGGSFLEQPVFLAYWYGLYLFVAINVFVGRFFGPAYNYFRFRFAVDEIVSETPDTVSIYFRGRGLDKFKVAPGQFIMVRILNSQLWAEEHPFSLSALPSGGRIRVTVKNVGDYTAKIQSLKAGDKVVISGPYGRFIPIDTPPRQRLYIAGGVGITPIRAMIEAENPRTGSVLIYGNKTIADTVFASELKTHTSAGLTAHYVYSAESAGFAGESGRVDVARIERLIPDFRQRDVYLCGPPPDDERTHRRANRRRITLQPAAL